VDAEAVARVCFYLRQAGMQAHHFGRLGEAEQQFLLMRSESEKLGPENIWRAQSMYQLGQVYRDQGRFFEALQFHQEALALYEKLFPPDVTQVQEVLCSLVRIMCMLGQGDSARTHVRRALRVGLKEAARRHPSFLPALLALGLWHQTQGRQHRAERWLRRCLVRSERALGPWHLFTADCCLHLAEVCRNLCHFEDAERFLRRQLAIREHVWGPQVSPSLATSLNILADIYEDQGRFAEAQAHLQRALNILEATAPENLNVAQVLKRLAILCRKCEGNDTQAEHFLRRALGVAEKLPIPDHSLIASILLNLSQVLEGRDDLEAERCWQRCVTAHERLLDADHPAVLPFLSEQIKRHEEQGEFDEAKRLLERSLAIARLGFGPESLELGYQLYDLGLFFLKQGEFEEAGEPLEKALTLVEKHLGPMHAEVGVVVGMLAGQCYGQGDFDRAERLFQRAFGDQGGNPRPVPCQAQGHREELRRLAS